MTFLVQMEGVLRNETGRPIHPGEALVRALAQGGGRVVISAEAEDSDHWLRTRGLRSLIELREDDLPGVPRLLRHLEVEKTLAPVSLVVSADPKIATSAFRAGVAVCLFSEDRLVDPRKRADGPRSWDEIAEEMRGRV